MTAGETTVTGTVVSGTHDLGWGRDYSLINTGYNFIDLRSETKSGAKTDGYWRFTIADLPANSKITEAKLRFVSAGNYGGGYTAALRCLARDGKWNRDNYHRWEQILHHDFYLRVLDTGSTERLETFPVGDVDSFWSLYPKPENPSQRLGQTWKNAAGTSYTLGSMQLRMQKASGATGTIGLEIYQGEEGTEQDFRDSTLLAVSSGIGVASLPNGASTVTFTFHGANQIIISDTPGDEYYVTVLTGTMTGGSISFVGWYGDLAGGGTYANGYALTSGTGSGFDRQNYTSASMLPLTTGIEARLGSTVSWAVPATTVDVTYETDDLSLIIQEAVNDPGYAEDGNIIGFNWDVSDASPGEGASAKSYETGIANAAKLIVTYKPRRIVIG